MPGYYPTPTTPTGLTGAPYPLPSEPPDGPGALLALLQGLEPRLTALDAMLAALGYLSLADLDALAALNNTGRPAGQLRHVSELGALFRYTGTLWAQVTAATFASATARDTAYAKGSAAYRVQGVRINRTDLGYEEMYYAAYNSGSNPQGALVAGWYPPAGADLHADFILASVSIPNSADTFMVPSLGDRLGAFAIDGSGWVTVPYAGRYRITALVSWAGNGSGTRGWHMLRNDTNTRIIEEDLNANVTALGSNPWMGKSFTRKLAATDKVAMRVYQNSGGALNAGQHYDSPLYQLEWVGVARTA